MTNATDRSKLFTIDIQLKHASPIEAIDLAQRMLIIAVQQAGIEHIENFSLRDGSYNTYFNIYSHEAMDKALQPKPEPDDPKEKEALLMSMLESAKEQKIIDEGRF
jgi:hypothetical protein